MASAATSVSKTMSYESMCKYYELCVPGLETKNPHFKSSLHLFKKELSPLIESLGANINAPLSQSASSAPSSSQQENQILNSGGGNGTAVSSLKLLFKGKKDNKIHVKCSCNDITDGSAIKRKFLVKCNKCLAMVHGKCHNLNAQLFNNNNSNLSSSWFCSTCTIDIQNDIRKNAMAEDIKRAIKQSPPQTMAAKTSAPTTKSTQNKKDHNLNKDKNKNNSILSTKSKHKSIKTSSGENNVEKAEKVEDKNENKPKNGNQKDSRKIVVKRSASNLESCLSTQQTKLTERIISSKKPRYIPIQPKQS